MIQIWCSSSYSCSLALSFIACITFFNSVFFSFVLLFFVSYLRYGTFTRFFFFPCSLFFFFLPPLIFLSGYKALLFCSLLFIYFLSCFRLFHIQSFHPPSASLTTTINSIVRNMVTSFVSILDDNVNASILGNLAYSFEASEKRD